MTPNDFSDAELDYMSMLARTNVPRVAVAMVMGDPVLEAAFDAWAGDVDDVGPPSPPVLVPSDLIVDTEIVEATPDA